MNRRSYSSLASSVVIDFVSVGFSQSVASTAFAAVADPRHKLAACLASELSAVVIVIGHCGISLVWGIGFRTRPTTAGCKNAASMFDTDLGNNTATALRVLPFVKPISHISRQPI